MAEYTFPDPSGGSMTVEAGSFQEAQGTASQQGWTPSMGTYGANTGPDVYGTPYEGQPSGDTTSSTTSTSTSTNAQVQQLGSQIDTLLNAIASGNAKAFEEAIRQFNLSFGLDQNKFQEAIRQFNANLGIAEAGLTGLYQGNRTLQAQQQAYEQQLGLVTTAAGLQANPFRQAQVIGQLGGLLRGGGVAGFQAPGQAQGQTDFSGMGNLQRLIDDIRGGPGAINSQSTQSVLDAIPTPTKLNSVEFARSSPLTQSLVLQGMQEKYGLSPEDSLAQIKNTLPQFQAPTTFGGIRR